MNLQLLRSHAAQAEPDEGEHNHDQPAIRVQRAEPLLAKLRLRIDGHRADGLARRRRSICHFTTSLFGVVHERASELNRRSHI